jgi:hypothetical protein
MLRYAFDLDFILIFKCNGGLVDDRLQFYITPDSHAHHLLDITNDLSLAEPYEFKLMFFQGFLPEKGRLAGDTLELVRLENASIAFIILPIVID